MSRKPKRTPQQIELLASAPAIAVLSPEQYAEAQAAAQAEARRRVAATTREMPVSFVEVWVIQHDTPKHPGKYVMNRRFLFHGTTYMPKSTAEEAKFVEHEDIEEVRRWVPPGLFRIVPKDDAVTIEMWI